VVSEETGSISFVENGEMRRNLDPSQLKTLLLAAMDFNLPDGLAERGLDSIADEQGRAR